MNTIYWTGQNNVHIFGVYTYNILFLWQRDKRIDRVILPTHKNRLKICELKLEKKKSKTEMTASVQETNQNTQKVKYERFFN